jgi:hypothetical protein
VRSERGDDAILLAVALPQIVGGSAEVLLTLYPVFALSLAAAARFEIREA